MFVLNVRLLVWVCLSVRPCVRVCVCCTAFNFGDFHAKDVLDEEFADAFDFTEKELDAQATPVKKEPT